ncbi:MAG: hypothetical protein AAF268_07675 [Cyanobacteria bacterium P01_A01_bin.3]
MKPFTVFPNATIEPVGPISNRCIQLNLRTVHDACAWVQQLPYGSNSSNDDSEILFDELQGTCTSKHGAIARLASELQLPIQKHLGFYRLTDRIVTGVSEILQRYNLEFLPQIHCFLIYDNLRVDLTEGNCNGKNLTIEDYDFVVPVQPDIDEETETRYYLTYLERYRDIHPRFKQLDPEALLQIREECDRQVKYQCSVMANRLAAEV